MFLKKMRFFFAPFLSFCLIVTLYVTAAVAQPLQSTKAEEAIVIDHETGTVLLEKNADKRMPTSSMSKTMTIYLVFQALKEGRLKLDDKMAVSEKAWRKGGSKMFVKVGDRVKVEDLIRGVVIQSGNDATIVLAEGISGNEDVFAESLTQQAQAMGMSNSHFVNASGWPDPDHYSTARDLAVLARHLLTDFPEYYHYFSEKSFKYNDIEQPNRNPLLFRNIGADGIKTGHTEDAGFGLMGSAVRNGRRLVVVVNGLKSEVERADESARLLEWAFRSFENRTLIKAGETVDEAAVWLGAKETVPLVTEKDVYVTIPVLQTERDKLNVTLSYEAPLAAPIAKGTAVGTLKVEVAGLETHEFKLVTGEDVAELGLFARTLAKAKQLLLNR
ncbi:MAG: D-alanyl-D-alanine carboxypeptidase [Pseudomonadota bacterium]|jgi:D-alanyl-D-alanine carboxypeptidase (penicillin-binding protein 5/6)|nr:D-alanyl-D-alanine carboxypeptidase [Pseudomonadota bacterium]QKK05733.1 MAG: D-alanyl-D-alanine carboxypeptidase [Pseudomonadota bacterium]